MLRTRRLLVASVALVTLLGCGARSSLLSDDRGARPGAGGAGGDGAGGMGGAGGDGGSGGAPLPCQPGEIQPCGSDQGVCMPGSRICGADGTFGPCEGIVGPSPEQCNGLDDDCNGQVDEGFGLGQACDGPDSDECFDDVITCDGCSQGPDTLEVCNGKDDNCNGVVDSDCEMGDCNPTLVVTGSTPSNPNCIDFPVEAGSTGSIEYPCEGGPVTATLGGVAFTGSAQNDVVDLTGTANVQGPDGCIWKTTHHIQGTLSSGTVSYSYEEQAIVGTNCWQPCTETGTVQIQWAAP